MKYSIALTEKINSVLINHLIRDDKQEDLCFAFYNLSSGLSRTSGLIKEILLPENGDRTVHGNVSFNSNYLDKVTAHALEKELGVCFIHSHPAKGWQDMSLDDIEAEKMLAPIIKAVTGLPLIGMTIGTDGTWSARFWIKTAPKKYKRFWCESVRIIGKGFNVYFDDNQKKAKQYGEEYSRTISAWGNKKQNIISRLTVGIIGLGSVGSIISESLDKTGITNIKLIDFDLVEKKNLDRLLCDPKEVGKLKVDVFKNKILKYSSNSSKIDTVPYSIIEEQGFRNALDCDILFSCVDRPWPRFILDSIAYGHLIPVIDGGIDANPNKNLTNIDQARWKAHTVCPERICMQCLGQYAAEDVALEQSGLLEDPSYIKGLPKEHFSQKGENVFAFSMGLAGMEMHQFLSFILQPRAQYYGPKEFDFNSGNIDFDFKFNCNSNCLIEEIEAEGDKLNSSLISSHPIAEEKRLKAKSIPKSSLIGKMKELILNRLNFF